MESFLMELPLKRHCNIRGRLPVSPEEFSRNAVNQIARNKAVIFFLNYGPFCIGYIAFHGCFGLKNPKKLC